MAEFTNSNTVAVAAGQDLPLTETAAKAPACIVHRAGSGLVTLRGLTSGQCRARFKVSFGGNIAIPPAAPWGPFPWRWLSAVKRSIARPPSSHLLQSKTTSAFSLLRSSVPRGCCVTVAVKNTSAQAVSIANSNLIVERVA